MNTKKIIVEVICFVLLMNWFYEGVYKVAYWGNFGFYIKHMPLLNPVWQVFTYAIPIGEIALALMFLFKKYRTLALYSTIVMLLLYITWIISAHLFTPYIFWPFHALWGKPSWWLKMLLSLSICWASFAAIILSAHKSSTRNVRTRALRNSHVNAQ